MTREEILAKLTEILINDFRAPAEKITEDATFRGTLGMDSLDAVDFSYMVKKTFGLGDETSAFRELHTVGKVADHVLESLGGAAAPSSRVA